MKWPILLMPVLLTLACDSRKKEEELHKREIAINEKEQQLLLKEKTLQLKEEELLKKENRVDSTSARDSTHIIDPGLTGAWFVKMTCTETTCAGSAVGDTKSETWLFSYESSTLIVRAMSNNQLIRVYTGSYTGNTIELTEEEAHAAASTKMVVRLTFADKTHLEGQRVITRPDCRILYSLQLEKERVQN